jgi:hypothetical protein
LADAIEISVDKARYNAEAKALLRDKRDESYRNGTVHHAFFVA